MTSTHVPSLILTALGLEYSAVRERLSNCKTVVHARGSRYEIGDVNGVQVAIAECGAGNTSAAFECERAINFFEPKLVLFVGIAGGLKDVRLGDVVFASKIYGYEGGKAVAEFLPRPQVFTTNYALLQAAKELARKSAEGRRALVGAIAAGEKVIASIQASEYKFLKRTYSDAVAVEMEGFGFLHAGYANNSACMVVRGISDLVDGKENADASGSQPQAARNATDFALQLIAIQHESESAVTGKGETLGTIAERLYPMGPNENQLWQRSGGDLAALSLNQTGRAAWFSALKLLYLGGGGEAITVAKLIETMLVDHPNNKDLKALQNQ